ncbi:MAG TPA: HRDC domain-containing protein [bacterium]|nr:HRDC domain-containing protein [bacterium]
MVESTHQLEKCISAAGCETEIAVDLEADSLHHYKDRVCLVQVSTSECDWIVDPQADMDLSSFWRLLESPEILHIFHDADFDIRSLDRDFKIRVRNIFDTKIAAELLGWRQLGLSSILNSLLGVRLSKKFQKYSWSRRPLNPDAVVYAAMDTRYLSAIKAHFLVELTRMNRMSWAQEEFRYLETYRWRPSRRERLTYWNVTGVGSLRPRQMELMRRLWHIREKEARRRDVPVFKVFSDRDMLGIAAEGFEVTCLEDLLVRWRIPPRLEKPVRRAVTAAATIPENQCPAPPAELTVGEPRVNTARFQELKIARDDAASRLGLDPGVIAGNRTLKAIASLPDPESATFSRLKRVIPLRRWQADLLNIS